MRGVFNGYSINGSSIPDWLRLATVIATAAATVAIAPTRTTFASASGDASVTVTLAGAQGVVASAEGSTDSSAYANPSVIYSGRSLGVADSTGNASIIRLVTAASGGDAISYGAANPADKLGEAFGSSESAADLCLAHIVKPSASVGTATLTATQPNGDVVRYAAVLSAGETLYTRAEASTKLSGQPAYSHDGYTYGIVGLASATIPIDRVNVVATFGSVEFCESTGECGAFMIMPAASIGVGELSSAIDCHVIFDGYVLAAAESSAQVIAVRGVMCDAVGMSESSSQAEGLWSGPARTIGIASVDSEAVAVRSCYGEILGIGEAASSGVPPTLMKMGQVNAFLDAMSGLAFATSNADVPAIAARSIIVEREVRGVEAPNENRTVVA